MTTSVLVEAPEASATDHSIVEEADTQSASLDIARSVLRKGLAIAGLTVAAGVAAPTASAEYLPHARADTQQKTIGKRAVAAIIVNFENETPGPYTHTQVASDLFTSPDSVSTIFKRQSFGKFNLGGIYNPAGDVYGPVTVKNTMKEACNGDDVDAEDVNTVTRAAYDAAEVQSGQKLVNYDDYVFLAPYQPRCKFGGISIGNTALINLADSSYTTSVSLHEIGHNMGLGHAKKLYCNAKGGMPTIDKGTCTKAEYDDYLDPMGSSRANPQYQEFNGYNKARLGWGKTKTIKKDSTVVLAPIDQPSSLVHSARVAIGGTKSYPEYLYLDYKRFPDHNTTHLGTAPQDGIMIRRATDLDHTKKKTSYASTILYDMNPVTISSYDAALQAGKVFRAKSGVTIETVRADTQSATVKVTNVDPSLVQPDFYMR